jgi:hypothetical protein
MALSMKQWIVGERNSVSSVDEETQQQQPTQLTSIQQQQCTREIWMMMMMIKRNSAVVCRVYALFKKKFHSFFGDQKGVISGDFVFLREDPSYFIQKTE